MKSILSCIFFLIMFSIFNLYAQEAEGNLSGKFYLAGPNEGGFLEGKSHFYFFVTGETAKTLYLNLPVKKTKDACSGEIVKEHGNIKCFYRKSKNEYECGFSINLKTNKIDIGFGC